MTIDFNKDGGLVPVIVQHAQTLQVLMLGYMNQEALTKTLETKLVTFFSRSKQRLWVKGETSGNHLKLVDIQADCDKDALLILANPVGPTCHKGTTSCFGFTTQKGFIYELEKNIHDRIDSNADDSYTNDLYHRGINKVAQKVGEEAVELVIESKDSNAELFINEVADLMYHLLVLLKAKGFCFEDIERELKNRSRLKDT